MTSNEIFCDACGKVVFEFPDNLEPYHGEPLYCMECFNKK